MPRTTHDGSAVRPDLMGFPAGLPMPPAPDMPGMSQALQQFAPTTQEWEAIAQERDRYNVALQGAYAEYVASLDGQIGVLTRWMAALIMGQSMSLETGAGGAPAGEPYYVEDGEKMSGLTTQILQLSDQLNKLYQHRIYGRAIAESGVPGEPPVILT